jgi:hypothetical protein
LEHGLLRGSLVPPAAIRELRDLTRYRKRLIQAHSAEVQRIQKTLEDAGSKLDSVAADVLGVSGRAMLAALVGGERDPQVLAELARGRLRNKLPQLRQALRGRFSDHHGLLVRLALAHLEHLEAPSPPWTAASMRGSPRSLGPGTSWPPSPGWGSGPRRRSSPRSAPT